MNITALRSQCSHEIYLNISSIQLEHKGLPCPSPHVAIRSDVQQLARQQSSSCYTVQGEIGTSTTRIPHHKAMHPCRALRREGHNLTPHGPSSR
ncbi:hypothetical protein E2C01_013795 [Portunus trituberculatus]|uniref:Uncharacterized protein n=1 Tax=Portunus trituberculatus TaxID=210409 RepID=A0A5B7DI07_PORTR|nr:hypothetical protein [Portunus trituberculatus]